MATNREDWEEAHRAGWSYDENLGLWVNPVLRQSARRWHEVVAIIRNATPWVPNKWEL